MQQATSYPPNELEIGVDEVLSEMGIGGLEAATVRREALEFAVIVPTFNEAANVAPLVEKLSRALKGISWEVVFVDDDSPDGTSLRAREIALCDRRVRIVQRVGRRGLSSAVVEGMLATAAPVVAVIDGDMQHDETILAILFSAVAKEGYDLAIGTRYSEEGGTGDWDASRVAISKFATKLSHILLKCEIADPMSGFFALRRDVFERALPNLSTIGFKILLDIVASSPSPLKIREVPYTFRLRLAGVSKLDSKVAQDFGVLLIDKAIGHIIPVRFVMFAAVGALGLLVHLFVLGTAVPLAGADFRVGQSLAVLIAMTFNYVLNNSFTYRDMRLRGWSFVRGLLTFYLVCLVGAIGNIGVGEIIYDLHYRWWLAGVAGAFVGVVWNYAVSSVFTWTKK